METNEAKRAVLYCRVSTKEQVEEGNSLFTQEKNCREYAQKNGYEIVSVFIEQGESAKTADRTELKKLMSFCSLKKNGIDAVIAYKIDRISRNTDDYSQIRILLKRYGVEIKSTSEYFEDTPAGRFMENIIANVAQFDNDVRTERSVGGLKDAVREGRFVWLAPYGYSNVKVDSKSTIAPNHLAPLVRKAFQEIAKNLYQAEDVRKSLIKEGFVNTTGKPISKAHFYRILHNKIYTGWITKFNETHKGNFEPLVSEELFNRVQWVLSTKRRKNKHYLIESPDFPLRRFFIHPNGQLLTGCWSQGRLKKYPYYLFHKQKVNIRKEVLESAFKQILNQFEIDDTYFEKLLELVKFHLDKSIVNKKVEIERLKTKITDLKTKQDLVLNKNIEGVISNELCKEKIGEIDNEIYQLKQRIADTPNTTINYSTLFETLRNTLKNPAEVWEMANFKNKIKLQWFYFPHGIVFDGNESRINKICNLAMLKEHFPSNNSPVVHHRLQRSNTSNLQISLRYINTVSNIRLGLQDEAFQETLRKEIVTLSTIIAAEA